ncbi:MAG: hypothetical protein FWE05_13655 [Defluviitaleaceae bacterium]|nr:hypothetical protein [Defluviitaleaceae bacterium]
MNNVVTINANVDTSKIDEAITKADRLRNLIKEAKSLADDLASTEINLKLDV